ncbi:sensor histidine kinase [Deinococcus ruber]|uniref:sensor histidine kinase n=1 Tax=Deinococcus ruber TaxID=1848197 RepID=UPI001E3DBEED|nr:HAMP domain-containing sensor histidine kinase [Deinococcus ruber]
MTAARKDPARAAATPHGARQSPPGRSDSLWNSLSLRFKLTLGYAVIFSLSVLLGAGCVYVMAHGSLTRTLDTTLHETASLARGSILEDADGERFSDELQPPPELNIELLSADGRVLDVAGRMLTPAGSSPLPPAQRSLGMITQQGRRVLTERLPSGLLLQVSRPSDTLTALLETLAQVLLAGSALMIGLACVAGYYLADRALKPVDEVARTAATITHSGSYRGRVRAAPGSDEMARLTGTVNSMLDHLEATIERERSFARTAAHELRTPLTALQGRLELALERPREAADYRRSLEIMRGRVDELLSLAQGLLVLAETDRPAHLEPTDLTLQAAEVTTEMYELATRLGKQLDWQRMIEPLPLPQPGTRLEELPPSTLHMMVLAEPLGVRQVLRNLLENALKYGGDRVVVRVSPLSLMVWDSGPGPLMTEWARLTRPFERGPGLQGVSGSGLGLPLVLALAQRWNARVEPQWATHSGDGFGVCLSWAARDPKTMN